jgi:hypothetical protein
MSISAQTPYFYYYKGEKQYLNLDTSHIFVSFPDENVAGMFASNIRYKALRADIPEKIRAKTKYKRFWSEVDSNLSHNLYWSKIAATSPRRRNNEKTFNLMQHF